MHLKIKQQQGLSLILAIFLIVVVAGLLSFMLSLSGIQRDTNILNIKGTRGLQAARSGIEWGVSQASNGICGATNIFNVPTSATMTFIVTVTCTSTSHTEGTSTFNVYQLISTATHGTLGNLDYVSRRLASTVSLNPP